MIRPLADIKIPFVTRYRALSLLAVLLLAASSLSGQAWAHPGHMPTEAQDGALVAADSGESGQPNSSSGSPLSAPRRRGPSAMALLGGALALLASVPNRRRTLALAFTFLLGVTASEGAFHALMHLGHLAHASNLVVGPSATQKATTDPESASPAPISLPLLGKAAPERGVPALIEVSLAADRGRAPPTSPA